MRSHNTAHPPWEVDGGESYNLRPVVRAIMDAENWILDRLPPGRTLFVILGEYHVNQMDIFLQQALLHAHTIQRGEHPNRTFSYGCEIPHNFLQQRIGRYIDDPHSIHGMNSFVEKPAGSWSVEARRSLFRHCLKEGISVGFNDLAHVGDLLDRADPYTRLVIERHADICAETDAQVNIETTDATGFAYRNFSMTEKAIAHAERSGARIYIVQCGNLHVAGSVQHGLSYDHSISEQLRKHGHSILAIINGYEFYHCDLGNEGRALVDTTGVKIRYLERIIEGNNPGLGLMPYQQARETVNKYSDYTL